MAPGDHRMPASPCCGRTFGEGRSARRDHASRPRRIRRGHPRVGGSVHARDVADLVPQAEGATWYPFSFLGPLEKNEPWLGSALRVVAGLVRTSGSKAFQLTACGDGLFTRCLSHAGVPARHARRSPQLSRSPAGSSGPRAHRDTMLAPSTARQRSSAPAMSIRTAARARP